MNTPTMPNAERSHADALVAIYDDALPQIYGYFHRRVRHRAVAEDLTTEVFMAAVQSISRGSVEQVTTPWLVGIARHKLVDHWRHAERERKRVDAATFDAGHPESTTEEPWQVQLDQLAIADVLGDLSLNHRTALTLRYVDDLPVPEVAQIIDRTVHATEALLVRARRAFRTRYEEVTP